MKFGYKVGPEPSYKWSDNHYKWPYNWVTCGYNPCKWTYFTLLITIVGAHLVPRVAKMSEMSTSFFGSKALKPPRSAPPLSSDKFLDKLPWEVRLRIEPPLVF